MQHQKKKKRGVKKLKLFTIFLLLAQLLTLAASFFLKKKKSGTVKQLILEEEEEFKELLDGDEGFNKFLKNTKRHLKNFFIPHDGNDHKPHSIRTKSLIAYLLIAVFVKLGTTGVLYIIYPSQGEMSALLESKMLELTNESRKLEGVSELRLDPVLVEAALEKGQDMIERNYFSHDTPDGKRPWEWIDKSRYDYVYAGENLAMGFHEAELVQEAFMKSPTHRKNILNSKYNDIGLAVVSGDMNGEETDVLVVVFGTTRVDTFALATSKTQVAENTVVAKSSPHVVEVPVVIIEELNTMNNDSEKIGIPQTSPESIKNVNEQPQGPVAGIEIIQDVVEINVANNADVTSPNIQAASDISEEQAVQENNQNVDDALLLVVGDMNKRGLVELIIEFSKIIFIAFLIFITLALILNIFVKVKIQHYHLVIQSIFVIAVISSLLVAKLHFIERIAANLFIL